MGNVPGIVYQFKIDSDGKTSFPYVSATVEPMLDLAVEDIVANPDVWFDAVFPDDQIVLRNSLAQSHRTLGPWNWEGRMIRASGEIGWFRGSSTPRRLDDGAVLWNGIFADQFGQHDCLRAERLLTRK